MELCRVRGKAGIMNRNTKNFEPYDSAKPDKLDEQILQALVRAERLSRLYNQPCNVVSAEGRSLQVRVRLQSLTGPRAVVLETVHPPVNQKH